MPEKIIECLLCVSNKNVLFDKIKNSNRWIEYRLCQNCGMVFQSPRMTEIESDEFYTQEYYSLQEKNLVNTMARNNNLQERRAQALTNFVHEYIPIGVRHLDIGCASGIILQCFQKKYKSIATGIEPDKERRNLTQKKGLEVYSSIKELKSYKTENFDLITMSHVLEHIREPIKYLTYLRENVLKQGGFLLIEVPNLYAHDCFELSHFFAFSPRVLKEVLNFAGFNIIKFEKHGRPHSNILPVYLTILCCPKIYFIPRPIRAERMVKLKRKFGIICLHVLVALFAKNKWFIKEKNEVI